MSVDTSRPAADRAATEPFLALLESLRSYVPAKTEDVEVVDTNYWLGELDKLSEK